MKRKSFVENTEREKSERAKNKLSVRQQLFQLMHKKHDFLRARQTQNVKLSGAVLKAVQKTLRPRVKFLILERRTARTVLSYKCDRNLIYVIERSI